MILLGLPFLFIYLRSSIFHVAKNYPLISEHLGSFSQFIFDFEHQISNPIYIPAVRMIYFLCSLRYILQLSYDSKNFYRFIINKVISWSSIPRNSTSFFFFLLSLSLSLIHLQSIMFRTVIPGDTISLPSPPFFSFLRHRPSHLSLTRASIVNFPCSIIVPVFLIN